MDQNHFGRGSPKDHLCEIIKIGLGVWKLYFKSIVNGWTDEDRSLKLTLSLCDRQANNKATGLVSDQDFFIFIYAYVNNVMPRPRPFLATGA